MSFNKDWLLSARCRIPLKERLLSKINVDSNGCWNYTGRLDKHGYGVIKVGGRNLGAHKVSYIINSGDFDQSKFEMMHECHNRKCINPNHLKPGTHKQNMQYLETRNKMRLASKTKASGKDFDFVYGVKGVKKGETILFGSSYTAEKLGWSSGRISSSVNEYRGRRLYRGFKFSYEGVLKSPSHMG